MPSTSRGAIPYPSDSDDPDVPDDMRLLAQRIAAIMAIDDQGPLSSRPAAGNAGHYYTATDQGVTYRDDGTTWRALNAPAATELPVGAIIWWPKESLPTGTWLEASGGTASRVTYSALFAEWGTAFGSGDGSTTFGLPDYRGRHLIHKGTDTLIDAVNKNDGLAVGSRKPSHTHTHTLALPQHQHLDSIVVTVPDHGHLFSLAVNAHSHGGGTGSENNSIGVQVASNPANVAARYPHQHGINPESPGVNGSIYGGNTPTNRSGGVGDVNGSLPSIPGSIASATIPFAVGKWIIKA